MTFDNLLHLAELLLLGAPLWIGLFRIWGITKDFPPHRHIGRRIVYPANVDREQFDAVINGETK